MAKDYSKGAETGGAGDSAKYKSDKDAPVAAAPKEEVTSEVTPPEDGEVSEAVKAEQAAGKAALEDHAKKMEVVEKADAEAKAKEEADPKKE